MRVRLRLAAIILAAMPVPAWAETLTYDGTALLSAGRNSGDNSCWVETDCPEGEICHMSLTIDGEPARVMGEALKAKVDLDPTFEEWGLEIYVSRNDGLYCDMTEPDNPRCTVNFNPQKAELEPPLSCE